ncbi:MAG: flagellar basal-body rod protein FlgG [Candidatus Margulisiibacteriota bacterium]
MFRPFYIAATGMDAFQTDLESIIDNVSNSQTTGYKKGSVEFANIFPQVLEKAVKEYSEGRSAAPGLEIGSGVKIVGTPRDFSQGSMNVTNNPMDVAIKGEGFLQFALADGTTAYSRAGSLSRDSEGMIVNGSGNALEPQISLPEETTGVIINQDGRVYVQINDSVDQQEIGQITLAAFINPAGLESIGDNLYVQTVASGEPRVDVPGSSGMGALEQFALEGSNVDIVSEMMRMIITQRSFDVISKAVQGGEGMLKSALEIAQG